MGETGDPTIGGAGPFIYFDNFEAGKYPNYVFSEYDRVVLGLSAPTPPSR